jgi:hypothetical protein
VSGGCVPGERLAVAGGEVDIYVVAAFVILQQGEKKAIRHDRFVGN